MTDNKLKRLEEQAASAGFLLRIKVSRPLNLWVLKVVVADYLEPNKVRILGEMKGWAYRGEKGLQLDTMRVSSKALGGIGHLIWAATMAWALEETPCKKVRLLAIRDDEQQHEILVRYFLMRGFKKIKSVGTSPRDLLLRTVWGGSGLLMSADCLEVYKRSLDLWCNANS